MTCHCVDSASAACRPHRGQRVIVGLTPRNQWRPNSCCLILVDSSTASTYVTCPSNFMESTDLLPIKNFFHGLFPEPIPVSGMTSDVKTWNLFSAKHHLLIPVSWVYSQLFGLSCFCLHWFLCMWLFFHQKSALFLFCETKSHSVGGKGWHSRAWRRIGLKWILWTLKTWQQLLRQNRPLWPQGQKSPFDVRCKFHASSQI